jgi:Ring finger domain
MGGDANQQGQPSASEEAIAGLEVVRILSEKRRNKHRSCCICLDDFPACEVASKDQVSKDQKLANKEHEIIRLPCHHLFHRGCIVKWLNNSATCPHCRYEVFSINKIMTANPEWNDGIRERMGDRNLDADTDTEDVARGPEPALPLKKKRKKIETVVDLSLPDQDEGGGSSARSLRPRSKRSRQ